MIYKAPRSIKNSQLDAEHAQVCVRPWLNVGPMLLTRIPKEVLLRCCRASIDTLLSCSRTRNAEVAGSIVTRSTASNLEQVAN